MISADDGCDAWFTIEPPPPPPQMRVWAKNPGEAPACFEVDRNLLPSKVASAIQLAKNEGFKRAMVVIK